MQQVSFEMTQLRDRYNTSADMDTFRKEKVNVVNTEHVKSTRKKSTLDICVRNPMTHHTWDNGRYISYEIAIHTTNQAYSLESSTTRRRYSEFEWLRKRLRQHHPLLKPPSLPPKKFFGDRFDVDFVAFRMKGLENFLVKVLDVKLFLSDAMVHLFIQSNLSCKEIDDVMEGRMEHDVIDRLWQCGGIKENCRDFNKNCETMMEGFSETTSSDKTEDRTSLSDSSQDFLTDSSSTTEEDSGPHASMETGKSELKSKAGLSSEGDTSYTESGGTDLEETMETEVVVTKATVHFNSTCDINSNAKVLTERNKNQERDSESESDIEVLIEENNEATGNLKLASNTMTLNVTDDNVDESVKDSKNVDEISQKNMTGKVICNEVSLKSTEKDVDKLTSKEQASKATDGEDLTLNLESDATEKNTCVDYSVNYS